MNRITIDRHRHWLWNGALRHGYGNIRVSGNWYGVHRFIWELFIGKIPKNMLVLHKNSCRMPRCCNPKHLYVGTHSNNTNDIYASEIADDVRKARRKNIMKHKVWNSVSKKQRSENARRQWANKSKLERSAIAKKSLVTKRARRSQK